MIATIDSYLKHLLICFTKGVRAEVSHCASMVQLYPEMGRIHPAINRERHVQNLFAQIARQAGYFTLSECNYFVPASEGRRIDLAIWIPECRRWAYSDLEPCGPHYGFLEVLSDAQKLVNDSPQDERDSCRCLIVYGFRDPVDRDGFPGKYREMSDQLEEMGFRMLDIQRCELDTADFNYFQAGIWVVK